MERTVYRTLTALTRIFGPWVFRFFSWWIATGFFFLFPRRVAVGVRFYRALYPARGRAYHLWCTWRQYHNFTHVFLDRFLLHFPERISYTSRGLEHLVAASKSGRGGIILMSHMGNWEIAARLLQDTGIRLLLYMGARDKERIERIQKETLSESGITIIAVEQDRESPLDILEGVRFIGGGGFVSITGDRLWRNEQRAVPVRFIGRTALVPQGPHAMALLARAPLFIFFIFRTGTGSYHITCSDPIDVAADGRAGKRAAVRESAQTYADHLERALREHPTEWYHFEEFITDAEEE
ncbi:MAG: lysophospholipid acyltransferase family protein [Spirochaetes bacterium]|nr:lysophospholipid acyltransferase family protein [Spirochaetota bacterium]